AWATNLFEGGLSCHLGAGSDRVPTDLPFRRNRLCRYFHHLQLYRCLRSRLDPECRLFVFLPLHIAWSHAALCGPQEPRGTCDRHSRAPPGVNRLVGIRCARRTWWYTACDAWRLEP